MPQVVTIIRNMDYRRLEILTVETPEHQESVQSTVFRKGWWRALLVSQWGCVAMSRGKRTEDKNCD